MEKTLDYYIARLPQFIGKEIFKYIIYDADKITFNNNKYQDYIKYASYSLKYEVAYRFNSVVENLEGIYLSRIPKKNEKHRYYLTHEKEYRYCQGCGNDGCCSYSCRGGWDYDCIYHSKYVGKDMQNALLELSFTQQLVPAKSSAPIFISSHDKGCDLNEW